MKPWRSLSDSERISRLQHAVVVLMKQMEAVYVPPSIPGYQQVSVGMSMDGLDDFIGAYGGNLTKEKEAA